jgi:hypothetical protein
VTEELVRAVDEVRYHFGFKQDFVAAPSRTVAKRLRWRPERSPFR